MSSLEARDSIKKFGLNEITEAVSPMGSAEEVFCGILQNSQ